jgi:hypothetical protein
MGVLTGCEPRKEVLKGDLDDAIFAADFGDLIAGSARKVYSDAPTFFRNTHPAQQLCKVTQAVFARLANPKEGGATIRLSTGFGGGKTHTLMALWHLAQNIADPSMGTDLLPAAGRPKKVTLAAADASKAGATFGRHGKLATKSLHGELAFQLGGEKALRSLGAADDPERQPDETLVEKFFPTGPVLILLDELVVYMATLSERGQGNLMAFMKKLAAVVSKRRETVLVVTDPAGQIAYAKQVAKLGDALRAAAEKLDELFARTMTDFDPIGKEGARVIVRRLFENVGPGMAQAASATYLSLYQRVTQDSPGSLPPHAASADYAKRIVECYPFHPRLLDTAQDRLGALQDFQKSRGVLRLFARILRDVWEAKQDHELISAGEINWSSHRIQADLLQRLNRDNFKAAISADIEKHAKELDGDKPRGIHCRVASALLLESLPMQPNAGLDPSDLALAVLRPEEAGSEPAEALDRLAGVCWHTYPMPGGRGWQFRYEPNIIRQIDEKKGDIPIEDAKSRVLLEVQGYFGGPSFKLAPWPEHAKQVTESTDLQLALCENETIAKSVCAYSDDSDPKAPIPRRFRNAIVSITATDSGFSNAIDRAQRLLAAEAIERENKTGESAKLVREQLQRIKPDLLKQFRLQACRAFDRVVLPGGAVHSIEERFQVADEQILQRAQGQACLRKFLDEKKLIYQPGDALDVDRFLKDVLPGTTPLPDKPGVYTTKAVHERFLSAPGLRLIPDGAIVRQTILKAMAAGKIVVRTADGRAYESQGCVAGQEGMRRRMIGTLTSLPLDQDVQITLANSSYGKLWTKVDEPKERPRPGEPGGELPPPPPSPPSGVPVTAVTWERAIEYAEERPLLELRLVAHTPADATQLMSLAQPFGADTITLSVSSSGNLKDGGTMNFAAYNLKPSHPTKPLGIAETVFTAVGESCSYEAAVELKFGEAGRSGMQANLERASKDASDRVDVQATFGVPAKGAA